MTTDGPYILMTGQLRPCGVPAAAAPFRAAQAAHHQHRHSPLEGERVGTHGEARVVGQPRALPRALLFRGTAAGFRSLTSRFQARH